MFCDEGGERGEDLQVSFQYSVEGRVGGVFIVVHSVTSEASSASSQSSVGEFVDEVHRGFGGFVEDVVIQVGIDFLYGFMEFGEDSFIEVVGEGVGGEFRDFEVVKGYLFVVL